MQNIAVICTAALLLSACGSGHRSSETQNLDVLEVSPPPPQAVPSNRTDLPTAPDNKASSNLVLPPQIAYKYSFGYRLGSQQIGPVQRQHVALCDALGTMKCRIVNLQRENSEGEFLTASLSLQIDSKLARAFGAKLDMAVTDASGDTSNRSITAEDISKNIVDTAARIKAKQALADRLFALLQNRSGKVGELVEAERAFAEAQEELDAARSWMSQMQQRVSMSKIDVSYQSTAPANNGFWRPIRDSFASAGLTLGNSISAVVIFALVAIPWLAMLLGLIWVLRKFGWTRWFRLPWRKHSELQD